MSGFVGEEPGVDIAAYFNTVTDQVIRQRSDESLRVPREVLLEQFQNLPLNMEKDLALRELVINHGLSWGDEAGIRATVWKRLIGTPYELDEDYYRRKLEVPRLFDTKIRDDSFRTFKGEALFWASTTEDAVIRVLNALAVDFGYVQGMNVLLGPFLCTMPEVDSYFCMKALLQCHIPRYVTKNIDGVHEGTKLLSRVLEVVDHKLWAHLSAKISDLSIFSVRYVLTLMANVKPLMEVIKMWDAIFAFGVHLNVLLLCSKLMLMRTKILAERKGSRILVLLEDFSFSSDVLVEGALSLVQFLPEDLFCELASHPLKSEKTSSPITTSSSDSAASTSSV
ncbi:rab-GTPase-TBC domain-containing protein [Ochromonadaceae sp. CCMP2298]|nr:rab-GTPase-TBC domain-containing protein [Ochromonadaceae sp. CCMP2298]